MFFFGRRLNQDAWSNKCNSVDALLFFFTFTVYFDACICYARNKNGDGCKLDVISSQYVTHVSRAPVRHPVCERLVVLTVVAVSGSVRVETAVRTGSR